MVATTYLLGYKQGSRGVRNLQGAMRDGLGSVYRRRGVEDPASCYSNRYTGRLNHDYLLVNWGSTKVEGKIQDSRGLLLLNGRGVETASNKLKFFKFLQQKNIDGADLSFPSFTTNPEVAQIWLDDADPSTERPIVIARSKLQGHSGDGIFKYYIGSDPIYYENEDGDMEVLGNFPLYVKYIPKQDEFRIHFFKGIDHPYIIQKKRKRNGTGNSPEDFYVRSHHNGWVYCRDGFDTPDVVLEQASIFKSVTPLDFGALDIIYNRSQNKAYILECNTAPGIEGQTVQDYVSAFKKYADTHDFRQTTLSNSYLKRS